ncbi:outer membrane beta-barrel protein [Ferruginibacter sp. SUN002]|uniref:outer membrane beta-barrel protein n=1 Tax=Ferruginibacter sp. SUN002 TaxID=2937789 RepID=UPI003D368DAC
MKLIQRIHILLVLCMAGLFSQAQVNKPEEVPDIILSIANEHSMPVVDATVELLHDNKLIKVAITDSNGIVVFENILKGTYAIAVTHVNYAAITITQEFPSSQTKMPIILKPRSTTMQSVTVSSKKPFIQHTEGKVILNIDASITNVGATVLEVLEKSPGVMIDRNGDISLKGKAGVLVLIDDKPTFLSGTELNNLLSSMNASQVEKIELMTNPPAKYDASGNAGVINIKTKKSKAKGFNGSVTLTQGQGFYPKENGNVVLNYRTGKFNMFFNYNISYNKYFTTIYALRKYYDNGQLTSVLDQPTRFTSNYFTNTVKTGVDYFVTPKTTIGAVLSASRTHRKAASKATATWFNEMGINDSTVTTYSNSDNPFENWATNVNLRHKISTTQDIAIDVDGLNYKITNEQDFKNSLQGSGGYTEMSRGNIPSVLKIISAKVDHTLHFGGESMLLSGFKSSHINTDNVASYQNFDGTDWQEDYGKSNHFLYKENINALYSSIETKYKRFSMQVGLRYEFTNYDAHQLGNVVQKDSAFSRKYSGLFPSGYITYQADSSNSFTLTAGRRIDRPAFQSLNPFTFIINKYTYETGNPFIVPQYSWNLELTHQYKEWLISSVSYSIVKNYFSQLFLTDINTGLLFYSQGNVGRTHNLGLSATLMMSPLQWWSFNLQAQYNHKELKGYDGNENFRSDIDQLNINLSNQFTFAKKYSGEISGYYTTRARNDLQELLYPTGQLSIGVSRPILKNKGTVKMSVRDIFYTQAMEGLTQFEKATEYFIVRRDSRLVNLSFTYRFGKAYKVNKRTSGSAGDEIDRVGSGR